MLGVEQLERLWGNLLALGPRRLAALGVVGLAVFAAVGLGSYYLSRSDMETLYSGLNSQDVSRIGAALRESGIAFDVNSEGTRVMVRRGETAQARMLLAEKGLPASSNAGYELFDKLGPIGLTSFMQEVTRVRAIEGELSRTIQAMKGVKAARVHIVLPETGSFRRGRQPASASVVIRTEVAADASTARAIRHLVAAAVPGLTIDDISVLHTDGTVLASAGDGASTASSRMIELEKTISKDLGDNVRKTLTPYLGFDNFEVSVAARLNMDKRQTNETTFDPDSRVERSLRVVKESGSQQDSTSRNPVGVEQNVPDQGANGAGGDQSLRKNERREDLSNFELNSKTTSTISEGYRIDALTIAVVVNRKRLLETLGVSADPDAVQAQIKEMERLVATAAGVDTERGDQISVVAVEFAEDSRLADMSGSANLVGPLIGLATGLIKALTVLGLVFIVVMFGVRPVTRALLEQREDQVAGGALAADGEADDGSLLTANDDGDPMLAQSAATAELLGIKAQREPNLIEDITSDVMRLSQRRLEQMVQLDEEQAANILKQWMRERAA
ncbi:flagellar basal-body MS-ring/collar protein FliF [Hyphomicrobium sp.]|uniref:flagellar basal-body MS-ring/collar protein FliF n=1 Tax=Hyphomicrobium sp. TaxID=82 RepID=UPI002C0F9FB8|nr:flagellar basal-body MS-ring/collar protein FliF [Hyphomicrobium sp.]HRN88958.1 flagellar basal-body MS-ring/collar protein FliF [Hyphomicrobium sp.]HRQ25450.1 flagellar basal-body MS-ring/collar protein FliF [Hyphomicrobium sp.]